MSDPLAVFTSVGFGATNRGLNAKFTLAYPSGEPGIASLNALEIKGFLGEELGWDRTSRKSNDIDTVRLRRFSVNGAKQTATQIDATYNFKGNNLAEQNISAAYSYVHGIPEFWNINLYPLGGVGLEIGKNAIEDDDTIDSGYSIMGINAVIGMFAKLAITKKIWLNYNPLWIVAISGSDRFENHAYGNKDNLLTHEFAIGYQINPQLNLRYFANWNNLIDYTDGDHRLEFNYQF
ncbi:hypothetical protein ABMA77_02530 [Halobacteriovorax sp. RZ-1]